MIGVCSAGLASTALPAARAAAIWPVKIASGKFHGLMQVQMPRGCCALTGLGRVVAQEINRFAQFGDGVGQAFACFAGEDRK